MWPPYQKSGSRRLTLREPLWLSWLETFHMHCIGIIKLLKYTFPNKILFSLYNSLFIPYIQYGLLLWGSKYSNVEKLQK